MMNSFYNGVSGVKSNSFSIDVTANNIANVNTTGFKYSDAQFKDIFYTTITTQSTNPAQGGYGSGAASSQVFSSKVHLLQAMVNLMWLCKAKDFLEF